jgi:hypothetical protein
LRAVPSHPWWRPAGQTSQWPTHVKTLLQPVQAANSRVV